MAEPRNPFAKKAAAPRAARAHVKAMVRQRFRLGETASVMVAEIACQTPGCPPIETMIAFWGDDEKRRHYRVFKPVADVVEDDLPPWWMKDALVQDESFGCPCC